MDGKGKKPRAPARNGRIEPPLVGTDLLEKFVASPKGEPPANLRSMLLADIKPYKLKGISRRAVSNVERVEPMRPQWVGAAVRPAKARIAPAARVLNHRGRQVTPGVIFPPDDRRIYNDRRYPWGLVCKILTGAGSGSGIIVGPRHVLTASHVVDWTGGSGATVEVHRAGGSVAASTPVTNVWHFTKVTDTVSSSEVDEDYAVMVTQDRIGDMFGWLGTRTYDSGWDGDRYWWSLGYPGDLGGSNWPVWQNRKWLNEDAWDWGSGRSMTTDADLIPGQSGSPFFAWWSDGPYVVAVWSSFDSENWCSGGSDMTYLVKYARNKDP